MNMASSLTLWMRDATGRRADYPPTGAGSQVVARFGPTLVLWVTLTADLQGALWISGWRSLALASAVEQGAAVIESRKFGEEPETAIRSSIRTQRETLPFWTALALIGDFVFEPASLVLRAVAVVVAFSALAALSGRPVRFDESLAACAAAQGLWVLGLAVRLGLTVYTGRLEAETSLILAMPPGTYWAPLWVPLHQVDIFALLGWGVLARGAWRRGQVHPVTALLVCGSLWATEAAVRVAWTLTVESGMRMLLIPQWIGK
jgi:hypothetical protein